MIREKTIFRNFLFGAVLLAGTALAVSCSVDDTYSVSDANAISFKSVVATRAAATTVNTLEQFQVWGWKVDGEGNDLGTLMNGVVATNDGTGTYYTEKTYYWPGCAVDFLGISPVGVVTEETATTDNDGRITAITYTVPTAAAEQADLLYAYTPGLSSGTAPMNFRHALTQVEFKALNTNSWMTVEIAGVKIASVADNGKLTLPSETTSATNGAYGEWTPATADNSTAYAAGLVSESVTLGSEATTLTADGGALFLIPQEAAPWDALTDPTNTAAGAYFLISCRITELGVELWPGDGTCAEIAIPCDIAWEQGKKYTYTFFFGEGAGYYPPTTTDTSLAGTPILSGPIDFDVEVGDLDTSVGSYDEDDEAETYVIVKTDQELRDALEGRIHKIVVEADITLTGRVGVYTSTTIVIEDGYTITIPNSTDCGFTVEHVFTSDEASLVFDGDGTIATTGTAEAASICCVWVREGYVIINGCTFLGGAWNATTTASTSGYCVYCEGYRGDAIVEINGGYFESGSPDYTLYCNTDPGPWESVIDDTTGQTVVQHPDGYVPYTVNFIVNGGHFYMYDPSSTLKANGENKNYVSSGHSASEDGDWYVVK